jgi:dTDP-4-amino-4,6-dideoxygalactose transaminase
MSETTTRSLYLHQRVLGANNEAEFNIIGRANNLREIAQNALRKALDDMSNMISDDDGLNYTMALYNNMYALRNPTEIREFLKNNRYLISLVSEAYQELQRFFPRSPVSMKIHQNEMVVAVKTSLSPEDADEMLDNFDEEWWIEASARSNARLCITVEFQ